MCTNYYYFLDDAHLLDIHKQQYHRISFYVMIDIMIILNF